MAKAQFRTRIEPQGRGLVRLNNLEKQWLEEFPNEAVKEMAHLRKVMLGLLRREPGSPIYPIYWTPSQHPEDADKKPNTRWGYYSRQFAAYMASQGFGKGIPSPRTGRLVGGWKVQTRRTKQTVYMDVSNDAPEFSFVQGEFRQQMFDPLVVPDTWPTLEQLIADVETYLDKAIPIAIDNIIDRFDAKDGGI